VCHSVLQCVTVCCSVSQCVAVYCKNKRIYTSLQCVAVCCSVSQCVAVCHSVLQYVAKIRESTHRCHPYPLRYPKSKNHTPHPTPMIECRALLIEYGALLLTQYGGISSQKSKANQRLFQKSCFCVVFICFCLALFFHPPPFQMCIV